MANSESPFYIRPADKREKAYFGFEANGITTGATVSLSIASAQQALVVHRATMHIYVPEVGAIVTLRSASGQTLFKTQLDQAAVIPLSWGVHPWGFRCATGANLELVVTSGTTFALSIQGWGTK